ncbi:MAG: TonB-dependent receptor [Hyphomonadaceae bacterium]
MSKNVLFKSASVLVLSSCALELASLPAYAQQAEEATREVVIVTATRRDETVQDAPINVAAVGSEAIQEQGLEELSDVLAVVPGISLVDQGPRSGNQIIVRGLNADPISSEEGVSSGGGTVATYVGEVPFYVDLKLNDLERVEVLLGPQGTLYGAGTLGGAIRYIPKKPDFDVDSLELMTDAYSYSEADGISTDTSVIFNKSFGDRFAIRGSVGYQNNTGFIDYPFVVKDIGVSEPDPDFSDPTARAANFAPVKDANGVEALYGRLAARWQPTDWLDATLTYYHQFQDVEGRTVSSHRSTVPAGKYEAGMRVVEPNQRRDELLSLEVIADLGFAELTSASAWARYKEGGQRDQTDLLITLEYSYEAFPTFTAFTREDEDDEYVNQELRLVSKTPGPLSWIVGAFYNHADGWGSSKEFTPHFDEFAVAEWGADQLRPDVLEYYSVGTSELTEKALFGEIGYDVTDKWNVTVGGRYYEYNLKTADAVDFPLLYTLFYGAGPDEVNLVFEEGGQKDNGTLFKFNTSYDITPDFMTYLTVSEGYRIGNSNGVPPCGAYDPSKPQGQCALAPGQQYGPNPGDIAEFDERQYLPDKTKNYEIGFKSSWFGGDLIVNGDVFYIDWTDPQVSSATVNASIPITINASGAESKGLELTSSWRATDNWSFQGAYSRAEARLTEDVPSLVRTITPPGFGSGFEDGKVGDRLPGAPGQTFSAFANYVRPLSNGADIKWNFGYSWQDDVLTRTGGRGSSLTLDSFGIANTALIYDAGQWSVTGYIKNLFDEYAETGVRGTSLYNQTIDGANVRTYYVNVAPPRQIGVRFAYKFGG